MKPLAGKFSKEENHQAALKTIDEVKAKCPTGKDARGLARTARTKLTCRSSNQERCWRVMSRDKRHIVKMRTIMW